MTDQSFDSLVTRCSAAEIALRRAVGRRAEQAARLSAAAPALLAALQRLDRLHRGLDARHEDAWSDAWAQARSAILAATSTDTTTNREISWHP